MSETKTKSHAMAWTVAVLIAVPVLYLLSVPPLYMVPPWRMIQGPFDAPAPEWVYAYAGPDRWLVQNTALRDPLVAYWEWWQNTTAEWRKR